MWAGDYLQNKILLAGTAAIDAALFSTEVYWTGFYWTGFYWTGFHWAGFIDNCGPPAWPQAFLRYLLAALALCQVRLLKALAFGLGLDPTEIAVGGDEQRRAIFAKLAVARLLTGQNFAEHFAIW